MVSVLTISTIINIVYIVYRYNKKKVVYKQIEKKTVTCGRMQYKTQKI